MIVRSWRDDPPLLADYELESSVRHVSETQSSWSLGDIVLAALTGVGMLVALGGSGLASLGREDLRLDALALIGVLGFTTAIGCGVWLLHRHRS